MENLPGFGDLFKLIDERFGRFWGSLLLLVSYIAVMAGLLAAIWKLVGAPIAAFLPNLFGAGPLITVDNLTSVIASSTAIAVLAGAAAIIIPLVNNLSRRRVSQAAIDSLAELRSESVIVLNDIPNGSADVVRWTKRWTDWKDQVVADLKRNFTKAETLSFDRIGILPITRFPFEVTPEHGHYLMILNKQLTILEDLIERHQERR